MLACSIHAVTSQFQAAGGNPLIWMISGFLVWGFFQIGGQLAAVTRFLTTTDDKTMKRALFYLVLFQCFIYMSGSIIALGSLILFSTIEKADMIIPTLCMEYLHPLLGGTVIAAASLL